MQQHPLSAKYWPMPDDELQALAADIKAHGLRYPIITYQGQVLDGWMRWLACKIAGVKPREIEYKGSNPAEYVLSVNEHRRHGSASQRALAIVGVREWAPRGRPELNGKNLPFSETTANMAKEVAVSTQTIKEAKKVETDGSELLKNAVRKDEISVSTAAEIAKQPKRKQARAIKEAKAPKPRKTKPEAEPCAKCAKFQEALDESDEKREILSDELKTMEALSGDAKKAKVAMQTLREELRSCTRSRNEAMARCKEMEKQIAWWRKQAEKLGWKPKDK